MAWASIAVAAWERMLFLVKLVISLAISTSRIRLSAELRFSLVLSRLAILCSKRFCMAPRVARWPETVLIAFWVAVMALPAWRGALARLGAAFPRLGTAALPLLAAQGRRVQKKMHASQSVSPR